MERFTKYREGDDKWYSPPFYSGPRGYKMRLKVYANGHCNAIGSHVSVYAQIIKGAYDDMLVWPYEGTVIFEIINWKDKEYNIKKAINFSEEDAVKSECGRKPTAKTYCPPYGYYMALPHHKLQNIHCQYIHHDVLYIRVSNISVTAIH